MNVKSAINRIERRMECAKAIANGYSEKAQKLNTHMDESKNKNERSHLELQVASYYWKAFNAEDYMESLGELINFLKSKDLDDKVVFIKEEDMENEFGIYGNAEFQNDEWSNTVAIVWESRDHFGNKRSSWVICIFKNLRDI